MLPIIKLPAKSLRQRSKEIDRDFLLSKQTQIFIKNLIEIMYASDGIGIAAPQVGKNIRICIIGKQTLPDKAKDLVLVNPIWKKRSFRKTEEIEGCLSVPKKYGKVKRWKKIKVTALGENGSPLSFTASDFFARVVQHEIDHLDGVLFIDKAKDIYTTE